MKKHIVFFVEEDTNNSEELDKLNKLLELVGARASISENKERDYIMFSIEYDDVVVKSKRTRGAGRKAFDEKWTDRYLEFVELYNSGLSREEIKEKMQISEATYYRYQKLKRDSDKT